jgi:hypothetical protein
MTQTWAKGGKWRGNETVEQADYETLQCRNQLPAANWTVYPSYLLYEDMDSSLPPLDNNYLLCMCQHIVTELYQITVFPVTGQYTATVMNTLGLLRMRRHTITLNVSWQMEDGIKVYCMSDLSEELIILMTSFCCLQQIGDTVSNKSGCASFHQTLHLKCIQMTTLQTQ